VRIESPEIVRESVEITSTAPLSRSLPKAITAIKLKSNEQASIDLPVVTPTVVASGIGILSTRVRAKSEGGSGLADGLADVGTTAPRQLVIDSTGDHSGQDAFGIGSYVEKTRDGRPQEVMYLLDVSSSMNKQNKLQLAVSALKDAVKMLKPADQFNLITFDANIHLYSKSLLTATLENVSTACRFLNQLQNGSGTNLSTAIEDGLKLTPSTLVVVSDGDPSRGIQDPDQICRMVRRWNISQTRIMTIALGSDHSDGGVRLLQQLASDHNGQMLFISLK
jgi:Mg-chelatase subunit ChlD